MRFVSARRSLFEIARDIRNVTGRTLNEAVGKAHRLSRRRHPRRRAICLVLILSLLFLPGSNLAYARIPELTGGIVRL
jgi:hypothetical protein